MARKTVVRHDKLATRQGNQGRHSDTGGRASYLKREERSILQNKTGHDKTTDLKLKVSGYHDRTPPLKDGFYTSTKGGREGF